MVSKPSKVNPTNPSGYPVAKKTQNPPPDSLDIRRLTKDIGVLHELVKKNFPGSAFSGTMESLFRVSKSCQEILTNKKWIEKIMNLHWMTTLILPVSFILLFTYLFLYYLPLQNKSGIEDGISAETINLFISVIVISASFSFFAYIQIRRHSRKRALDEIHRLRSIAHVIDLTQSKKDHCNDHKYDLPKRTSYLIFSSRAISLTAKVGATLVKDSEDSHVINAVNELDTICNGIAHKIWQKVEIIQLQITENRHKSVVH